MNKKLTALIISIICILVIVGGSVAYRVTSDTAKSRISASNVKIELVMLEEDADGNQKTVSGDTAFTPGETKSRIARVTNTGAQPAWVRVKAELVIDGETEMAMENPYTHLEGLDDGTNWTWEEGYWYYNRILEPGETTEALFTAVVFRPDSIDGTNGKDIDLKVDAEGTQSRHNGTSALEAKGWPAE